MPPSPTNPPMAVFKEGLRGAFRLDDGLNHFQPMMVILCQTSSLNLTFPRSTLYPIRFIYTILYFGSIVNVKVPLNASSLSHGREEQSLLEGPDHELALSPLHGLA